MPDDILIKNSLIYTMQGEGLGPEGNGAVYVKDGEITFVEPSEKLEKKTSIRI